MASRMASALEKRLTAQQKVNIYISVSYSRYAFNNFTAFYWTADHTKQSSPHPHMLAFYNKEQINVSYSRYAFNIFLK